MSFNCSIGTNIKILEQLMFSAGTMVIEKVHGLQATNITLNDRFTILATAPPKGLTMKPRRRPSGLFSYNPNLSNRALADQISLRLGQQRRPAVHQRLGMPGLRRFGSESSLIGLQRSNSFGNLSQSSVKKRVAWRQSNGNLNRSASFNNLAQGVWRGRGFRRRGGQMRGVMRGRINRGRGGGGGRIGWQQQQQGNRLRGQWNKQRGVAMRGRGRGGVTRQKKTVTKEELDQQLEQYMASTKSALDQELDNYMKNAMELE